MSLLGKGWSLGSQLLDGGGNCGWSVLVLGLGPEKPGLVLVPGLEIVRLPGLKNQVLCGVWCWDWEKQEPETGAGASDGLGSVEGRKDNLRNRLTHKGALDPEVKCGTL